MRFSRRTNWDMGESDFAAAVRAARVAGHHLLDLTQSNPTQCGFRYEPEHVLGAFRGEGALRYGADPLGMQSAREAVRGYYADHGAEVAIEDLLLTTSTSEGYGFLFRLLCDAGDEVLIAQPSYPLFDFLADLEDVRLRSYPLFYDHGWWIDFAELERLIGPRTRAIVVVHPNNPTGHATGLAERDRLEHMCAQHGLALIVDEVFLDYPLRADVTLRSFATGHSPGLTFVLSGLSKVAGLPQMKVGWIATCGPELERRRAMERLEMIGDTFLSLNTPAQLALPTWLAGRHEIQEQILRRARANLARLQQQGLDVLRAEAGWSAVLRLPQRREMKNVSIQLLEAGVLVQPGELYGFRESSRVIVSLLTPDDDFAAGVARIASYGLWGSE